MPPPPVPARLHAVNRVRACQRDWIETTRKRVAAGEPFALCNGDEAEEIFLALDIPVLAINYWNFLIAAKGEARHFTEVLNKRGYAGQQFFALGYASSLEPERAPWGGLPTPSIICGSGRSESELRVCELWARETGATLFPMSFSFPGEALQSPPSDWWTYTRDRWPELVDPRRLAYRIEEERRLISLMEATTGRAFDVSALHRSMELVNDQMAAWAQAGTLIAEARPCPVHVRDQMSMYQAMWRRGTPLGVELVEAYRDEVRARVQAGVGGHLCHRFAHQFRGAVVVANSYSGVPDLYARTIFDGDPLAALAGRHLFLFGFNPEWMAHIATHFRCDAAVVVEPHMALYPPEASAERRALEAVGVPYLALPRDTDDEDIRRRLAEFLVRIDPSR